nr:MAG TPA: hypothetical protein [Caudoviricetes sp.]
MGRGCFLELEFKIQAFRVNKKDRSKKLYQYSLIKLLFYSVSSSDSSS